MSRPPLASAPAQNIDAVLTAGDAPRLIHRGGRRAGDQPYDSSRAWQRSIGLIRALRPHQWVKNLLTVVPLISSGQLADATGWLRTLESFAAFSAIASAIYVVNDISDLAADRAHPRKRLRPFASGAVPIAYGVAMVPVLVAVAATLGWWSGAFAAVACYAIVAVMYTVHLKERPLVDVFVLATLYTIRLFGGGEASGHPVSLWLLGFSGFVFLSLALVKRVSELIRLAARQMTHAARRGYFVEDIVILEVMGCAATFASALVLSLYVQSDIASLTYARPTMLWGMVPLLLFWQCRIWLSTARGYMHDDPIVYAARDWVSWVVAVSLGVVVLLARVPVVIR